MVDLFPDPEPPKPSLLRVGKSSYQFPIAAQEIYILDGRGHTLWQTRRENEKGPIRWQGVDTEGKTLETGDYVCRLVYPDGKNVYVPFVFAAK